MNRGQQQLPSIETWKLKHSKEDLEKLAIDEASFNRGYRMNSVSPGELKFPSWTLCYERGAILSELRRRLMPVYIGVDLSSKNRPGNAIVSVGLDEKLRRYLLGIRFGAWTSPQTAGAISEVCEGQNVQFIQVENNAYQQAIIDWVQQEKGSFPYWMKVEAFTTGSGKADPQFGLPGLEVEFKNRGWVLPYSEWEGHPSACACDWCKLDREFRFYPRGATCDGVMALWFARDALNKWAPRGPTAGANLSRMNVR